MISLLIGMLETARLLDVCGVQRPTGRVCRRGENETMRKVVMQEFMSLDALVAGPNDSVDFIPAATEGDASFGREQAAMMDTIDTLLLGRITYTMFVSYWPNVTEGMQKAFADKFNAVPKVVFSKTLERAPWGTWGDARVVRGSAVEEVGRLKQQTGKDLLIAGSISIAQALIAEGMVDEYRLVLCPTVLGSGRPLFRNTGSMPMKLQRESQLDRGAVSLLYSS
jgi:dihydrofolate reductase